MNERENSHDGKEDNGKDTSDCSSKELDYGNKDLPLFRKKGGRFHVCQ